MLVLPILWASLLAGDPVAGPVERVRYLRPSGKEFVLECEFALRKAEAGSSIESVTGGGKTRLTVSAHYDDRDRLTGAEATLARDNQMSTATVGVSDGKLIVRRAGQKAQEFEAPPGVIVTSAPDWADAFLLCRRYDRKVGGKQSFPGLWIHPEQASQRLTFAIERTGADGIEHAARKITLGRYTIWLRGGSSYAAWADETGKMIKLLPLPHKAGAAAGIVLDGYEKSTAALRPPAPPFDHRD
jgi:hypothetical protein